MVDEMLAKIGALPPAARAEFEAGILAATSDMRWVPNPGPQLAAFNSKADELLYGGEAGGGKGLWLQTPLPTPSGWIVMGDVRVGSVLFDEAGAKCRVTAVSEISHRPCYRLRFDDGSTLIADDVHRWKTFNAKELAGQLRLTPEWRAKRRAERPSKVSGRKSALFTMSLRARNSERLYELKALPSGDIRNTKEIAETLVTPRGRRNHAVPVAAAIATGAVDLPIDPYVLGAWLGDGTSQNGGLTGIDAEIWEQIEAAGYSVSHSERQPNSHYVRGLKVRLRDLGLLNNKHVPSQYLRASYEQRLSLLQGLMDTDGHAALDGGCEFDNTRRNLADAVYELVVSLGIKATLQEGVAKLNGRAIGPKWRVKFTTSLPVFRLSRKLARLNRQGRKTQRFHYIVACDLVESVPTRCIAVDSPSRLYLAGRSMIPTHNTDLLIGSALTKHRDSLVLRRLSKEVEFLVERTEALLGDRKGYNGQQHRWHTGDDRLIQFGGCQNPGDEKGYKGERKSLIGIDEASEFLESQVDFLVGWLGSPDPNQHCQLILATNPPHTAEGQWLVRWFGPWIDPKHPLYPQPYGKLLWYWREPDDSFRWFTEQPPARLINGFPVEALSRTFIRSGLEDNPDYSQSPAYRTRLANMPEALRRRYAEGDFTAGMEDDEFQTIPTAWIMAAQDRWRPDGFRGGVMTAMSLDPAGGGRDSAEVACRYGGWYAPLISMQGPETADGSTTAAMTIKHRKDGCPIVVDTGGGYAGGVMLRFQDNQIPYAKFDGSAGSTAKAKDGHGFANKRAEAWWKFREELDPDQEGGSAIALPPDQELLADLAAPRWTLKARGYQIEEKIEIRKRLGRSPGKGDAVVMALSEGNKAAQRRVTQMMPTGNQSVAVTRKPRGYR